MAAANGAGDGTVSRRPPSGSRQLLGRQLVEHEEPLEGRDCRIPLDTQAGQFALRLLAGGVVLGEAMHAPAEIGHGAVEGGHALAGFPDPGVREPGHVTASSSPGRDPLRCLSPRGLAGDGPGLGDLLLLAEIAWEYAWGLAGTAPFPTLPDGIDDREQVAVAYLIRGVVAVAAAASLPPARREPAGALAAETARMAESVAADEAAIGVLSTGETIAVALVLNRADLLPHGYTWIGAVDRLGPAWFPAAHAVQRQRAT